MASLADYNFLLEYQKGKDNTATDFLSRVESRLPEDEVEGYMSKIPQPGVEVVLNNAGTPIAEWAEAGIDLPPIRVCLAETLCAYPVRLTTLHVTDWKQAQRDDPAINAVIRNLRSPQEKFKEVLKRLLDKKAIQAYVRKRGGLLMKDGLLYYKMRLSTNGKEVWRFVIPKSHHNTALDGCHHEAAHQGEKRSLSLMTECFWWPGMAHDLINKVKNCARCKKFEGAPPIAKLQKLPCSGPGKILHIDFTTIEETIDLQEKPEI